MLRITLTPSDIENKSFKKAFRGYSPADVDEFLDTIIKDFEKLCKENATFKSDAGLFNEEISSLKEEISSLERENTALKTDASGQDELESLKMIYCSRKRIHSL